LYNPINSGTKENFPIKNIDSVHTSFSGDRELFLNHYGKKPLFDFIYPYPGLYGDISVNQRDGKEKKIIVGNSGDPSNEHVKILIELSEKSDIKDYKIVLPVAYNFSPDYKRELQRVIRDLNLDGNVHFHTNFILPNDYLDFLNDAEICITAHNRQQSMGNLLMSLFLNKPSFLRKEIIVAEKRQENPGWTFLTDNGMSPMPFESFKNYTAVADIPEFDEKTKVAHRQIIREDFGIGNRASQFAESCLKIKNELINEV